jgi:type VI secretion system protein ImpG
VSDSLVNRYNTELGELRRLTAAFAHLNPGRLRLSEDSVEDPHVLRLLEGVALLNARIREKIEDEFPELTDALLDHLHPHYLAPIPSMAIAEVTCQKDLPGCAVLAAGTEIITEEVDGESCCFSTAQEATLWPVIIEEAVLMSRPFAAPANRATAPAVAALRLKLRCAQPDQTFAKLGVDTLRFFLRGAPTVSFPLHELICSGVLAVAVAGSATDAAPVFLGPEAVRAVGFEPQEGLLPAPARATPGYRLLSEFFVFPQKFLFFEVSGLRARTATLGSTLQIYLYLNRTQTELERVVGADALALNCVPLINLFRQHAESIRLTRMQTEYRVVPASSRTKAVEVYSIDQVTASSPDGELVLYRPFYALTHAGVPRDEPRFWHAARRPAQENGPAFESYLTLVDLDLDVELPADWTLSVETTCTNRNLPQRLPFGAGRPSLHLAKPLAAVRAITVLTAPTAPLRLPNRQQGRWRLISHLLLNHLSVTGGEAGADALKEMLRLYDFRDSPDTRALIDSILSITSEQRTARVPGERGALCRGIDIQLKLVDTARSEIRIYLLASVLERVFALQATLNSFTRFNVSVRGRPELLYKWPARAGSLQLL